MSVEQRSRGKRGYVPLFVAICLFALSTSTAFATTYTVTMTGDVLHGSCGATCSLRDAIIAANLNPGPDTIILGSGQTYTMTLGPADLPDAVVPGSGDLDITGDLTIDGNNSTVDASLLGPANLDRVFDIQGTVPAPITVTINNLTITG